MLNIVCVKWGDLYSAEYVNILADMVLRNLSDNIPLKFICFTDDPQGIDADIDIRELPDGLSGWWNKLYLFKDGLFPEGDRILYLDLDTVITGSLDDIIQYKGTFAILRDFYRPEGLQSSVMAWEAGRLTELWSEYERKGFPHIAGGDQAWIEMCFEDWDFCPDIWQEKFPGFFNSYKVTCKKIFPKSTKLVVFHGEPRPHQVMDGWVPQVWKIGGGTTLELMTVGNTSEEQRIKNIQHAVSLTLPLLYSKTQHDGHAVIVGGGPSLNDSIDEIRWRKSKGQTVFATNNTPSKVEADYHVMLDARPDNAAFVPYGIPCLYASECHPNVYERAKNNGNPITVWHSYADGMDDVLANEHRGFTYVGGGSSVGLKAMCIAYILGYREMHLYGMDSCYRDGHHHAYSQSLNDGERVISVTMGDKLYKVAPWMATQVEEFKDLAGYLVSMGCTLTVHGEGLLQDVARIIHFPVPAAQQRANAILARLPDRPISGAEIGVFAGDLSQRLLQRGDLSLYMVDSWAVAQPESDYAKSGDFHASLSQAQQEAFYRGALSHVEFAGDRAKVIRKPSIEAAKDIPDASLDFVFIDADHSYEGCKADIEVWLPKIKPGGMICGHDYNNTEYPFGVDRAVDEFCAGRALDLGENFTWFIKLN
jgi:hypothetical protein